MQESVISTQDSPTHTPYLGKWEMWIFPKCIM